MIIKCTFCIEQLSLSIDVDRELISDRFVSFKRRKEILHIRGYRSAQKVNAVHELRVIRTRLEYEGFCYL